MKIRGDELESRGTKIRALGPFRNESNGTFLFNYPFAVQKYPGPRQQIYAPVPYHISVSISHHRAIIHEFTNLFTVPFRLLRALNDVASSPCSLLSLNIVRYRLHCTGDRGKNLRLKRNRFTSADATMMMMCVLQNIVDAEKLKNESRFKVKARAAGRLF
ncbi:unnamed protein product [Vicia faba]|uniref:Uncharacterized protein n=1 Tax=Vicia faba TaxID=3906 RepID=A0AAV0YIQ3_VICFA|nr:unnamed protein product [Vicia faba]